MIINVIGFVKKSLPLQLLQMFSRVLFQNEIVKK